MLVLVTMGLLFTVVSQVSLVGMKWSKAQGSNAALLQAKDALIGYATTYRDDPAHPDDVFGYLPCPDTDGDGVADAPCDGAGTTVVGLLPYKTLGLPDLRDNSGACLWYIVSGSFKNSPPGSSLTNPNGVVPLNWDTQGQITVRDASDTTNLFTPDDANGGAAAVIIAAGAPVSANGGNRTVAATTCGVTPSALEVPKYLEAIAPVLPSAATITLKQGSLDSATNNNQILAITPKEIFDHVIARADFGNALSASTPGQINVLIDRVAKSLEKKIQDDTFGSGAPTYGNSFPSNHASTDNYAQQPPNAKISDIDPNMDIGLSAATSYANYLGNWSDQFRETVCNNLSAPCLDINNAGVPNCRGALVFSGRTINGQPRTSTQKSLTLANLDNYFEAGLDLLKNGGSFSGNSTFDNTDPTTRTADVASCLGNGTFISLKQNASQFASGTVNSLPGGGGGTSLTSVTGVGSSTPAILLGNSSPNAAAGCVWYANPLGFGSSLRLYFSYQVQSLGSSAPGFTLSLADAATNNPASTNPIMCGAAMASALGYSGAPGIASVSGVNSVGIFSITRNTSSNITVTTTSAHGFTGRPTVAISNVSPSQYNGNCRIRSIPSSTTFTCRPASRLNSDPGSIYAGITPIKVGMEFDTNYDSSRNDPSPAGKQHFGFVNWGYASDNNSGAARNGSDDNSHNTGVASDGAQPLNQRSLSITSATATPVNTIVAAIWNGSAVTATTAAQHGYANGQNLTISDISPLGYKGSITVTAVPDNTHFAYVPTGSPGTYPYVATISGIVWIGGSAAVTTSAAHGLSTGDRVTLSNLLPNASNGTYSVTVSDPTHFSVAMATKPTNSTGFVSAPIGTISSATWSVGKVTIATSANHNLTSDQFVTISGASRSGYNGTYRITVTSSTQFTYNLPADPGGSSSTGNVSVSGFSSSAMASPVVNAAINAAQWSSTTKAVIVTTTASHGFAVGQSVQISGISPATYNGVYLVTAVPDATHFTYSLAADPGGNFSNTTFATPAISTLKGSDTYFPHTSMLLSPVSDIHVRLDINRTYDASGHKAIITMKAYIDDGSFNFAGNCSLDDFQNFARDLSVLCPSRTTTIEQDGMAINDAAGSALSNIYLGFTTARSSNATDNQSISISNLILRSQ